MTPLDTDILDRIKVQLGTIKPLYPDIKYEISIVSKTKGRFNIKAPHYLVFKSEEKEGYLENTGFIGQQMDLYFSATGIGSCWLGASKSDEKEESTLLSILCMSFGKADEKLHRELSDFKRKPLSNISEGEDNRLEAARLAPSGVNMQNRYFIAKDDKIHCYRKKPRLKLFDKLARIDMGIAICHIAEESDEFNFTTDSNAPSQKGYIYMGTVYGGGSW